MQTKGVRLGTFECDSSHPWIAKVVQCYVTKAEVCAWVVPRGRGVCDFTGPHKPEEGCTACDHETGRRLECSEHPVHGLPLPGTDT